MTSSDVFGAAGPAAGSWVRFDWNLAEIPEPIELPPAYALQISISPDLDAVLNTVLKAYASDPVWQRHLSEIRHRMTRRLGETIGKEENRYLLVQAKEKLVAASGVAREHWTDQNLLTGICVLPDHQRQGIGRALLLASLHTLRDIGCRSARVYTEPNSLADRKIYPLFGSTRTSGVHYPGERLHIEANG